MRQSTLEIEHRDRPQLPEAAESYSQIASSPRGRTRKAVLACVVAFISAFLVLEGLARLAVGIGNPPRFGKAEFDRKFVIANQPSVTPCILFTGDSATGRSIYGELLEWRLAEDGFRVGVRNLAADGSYPKEQVFLLETALRAGVHPSAVVFGVSPLFLFHPKLDLDNAFSESFSKSYEGRLVAEENNPAKSALQDIWLTVERNVFLIKYRGYLNVLFQDFPRRISNPEAIAQDRLDEENRAVSSTGWAPIYRMYNAEKDGHRLELNWAKDFTQHGDYSIKYGYAGLAPIKDFCNKHNIPLLLAWLPELPNTHVTYTEISGLKENEIASRFNTLAQSTGTNILDVHHACSTKTEFGDEMHVNCIGGIKTTEALLPVLESYLPRLGIKRGDRE